MLMVVQLPMGDARGLSADGNVRLARPDWGSPITFGNAQFVRSFGHVVERRGPADAAWLDERFYCRAHRAVGLPDLQATRRTRCAFRRLFVAESRAVARVEIGLATTPPSGPEPVGSSYVTAAVAAVNQAARVPEAGAAGSTRPLITQGPRLARLYGYATSRKVENGSQAARLVEAGRPLVVIQLAPGEIFDAPPGATLLDPVATGGVRLAFLWLQTGPGPVPFWIIQGGGDPARARSLRLCLLRLHAEQQAVDVVLRFMGREWLTYEPNTTAGDRLTDFLNAATRRIQRSTWGGIQQSAILAALDAAESVTYADDREGALRSLEGAQRQVARKIQAYWNEREANRVVGTMYRVEAGGRLVQNSGVNIEGNVQGSNIFNRVGEVQSAVATFQASAAPDDQKQAVAELGDVSTQLIERLDDEKARADVAKRVEVITREAASEDPLEDVIRAAGGTLVSIGQTVQELANPVATAVNRVLQVLKFAPLIL